MIYYTRGERRGYFIAFFPLLKFNPSTCDHICTSIVGIESFREKEMRCREMGVSIFFDIGLRASKQANFSTALAQVWKICKKGRREKFAVKEQIIRQ